MVAVNGYTSPPYSVIDGCKHGTEALRKAAGEQLPPELLQHIKDVTLVTATDGTQIYFPCPFKETEAAVALKTMKHVLLQQLQIYDMGNSAGRLRSIWSKQLPFYSRPT